jgi:hypothetical protein
VVFFGVRLLPTSVRNLFFSSFSVFFPSGFSSDLPGRSPASRESGFGLMKPASPHCKCWHCRKLFVSDYRNRGRQQYCSAPECQQARKRAGQQRWLRKPANRFYFRDAENVQRVQEWRQAHPGYWKRSPRPAARTLQDACTAPAPVNPGPQAVSSRPLPDSCPCTLQDVCRVQTPLLVGLISKFTDCTLQDDIVRQMRGLVAMGQDLLDQPSRRVRKENHTYDDKQTDPAPGSLAASAGAV